MRIYFFDENFRYIGSRLLNEGEKVPKTSVTIPVVVGDGQQAYFDVNLQTWTVSDIPAEILE